MNVLSEKNRFTHLVSGAGAADAEGHGGPAADVGVVAFREEGDHAGTLLWSPTHKKKAHTLIHYI